MQLLLAFLGALAGAFVMVTAFWELSPVLFDDRIGRIRYGGHPEMPLLLRPRFLYTGHLGSDPWVWRCFWLRFYLGLMKTDWSRPTKLSRQMRRQLERKGRITMAVA